MTCNNVVDGVSKILTTRDVESLKAKKNVPASLECEAGIKRALFAADRMLAEKHITESDYDELLGVYMLRRILRLTGKGKLGPEGKQYEPEECNGMFVTTAMLISKLPANEIDRDWAVLADKQVANDLPPAMHADTESAASSSAQLKSLSDHTDGLLMMREFNFKIGDAVTEKGCNTAMFLIEACSPGHAGEATVRLLEHKQFDKGSLIINVKVDVFVKKFGHIFKGRGLPSTLDDLSCKATSPLAMKAIDMELMRCQAYKAIISVCRQVIPSCEDSVKFRYGANPQGIIVETNVKKGCIQVYVMRNMLLLWFFTFMHR